MLNKHDLLNSPKKKPVDEKNAEGNERKYDASHSSRQGRYQGQQFAHRATGAPVVGIGRRLITHITCYKYNRKGCYKDNCPEEEENDETSNEVTNSQHMQEGQVTNEEEGIQDGVRQFINRSEIEANMIDDNDDEIDSEDGSVIVNFQFTQARKSLIDVRNIVYD